MSLNGTILLRLSFGKPRFDRKDKDLTSDIQDRNKMSKDSGNYNKCLIPNQYFKVWDQIVTQLRTEFYKLTSPWDDSGYRICKPDAFWKFQRSYNEHHQILMTFVDEFIKDYPQIVHQQRGRLGDAFFASEFPPVETLKEKFRIEIDTAQVPEKGTLIHLGEAEEKRMIEKVEMRLQQAHLHNYQRLLETVTHLATTLKDKDKTKNCKSSTLTNLQELVDTLPSLNFKDDPILTDLADKAKELCHELSMKDIKQDDQLRERVAAGATETSQHIESIVALFA